MTQKQKIIKYCAIALAVLLIASIVVGILQTISAMKLLFGGKDGDLGEMKSYGTFDDVRNLKISLSAAQLEIKSGEAFSVESNSEKFTVQCKNGNLTLKDTRRSVFWGNSAVITVILTVPEGFVFDRVDIEAGAGNVTISDMTAKRFCMELGAGNVDIRTLSVTEETEIEGGTGQLRFTSSTLRDLEMGLGVGSLTMEARLLGDAEIECSVGTAEILLLGDRSDYRIELEKGLGDVTLNGEAVSGFKTFGDGRNELEIHGGVGSISVSFAENDQS